MSQGDACDECGENMYYERGGFFFCQECNTQSQVMRQIEESTIHYDLSATQNRTQYEKVGKRLSEMEKTEIDYGVPWTTHDAFGLLLKVQSETMVKLGAPKVFPHIVKRLWERYLDRKTGTPKPRTRDLVNDLSKGVPSLSTWRYFRKKNGKWPKNVDSAMLTSEERKDYRMKTQGLTEEELEDVEQEQEEMKRPKLNKDDMTGNSKRVYDHIQRMRMEYSLCFLYLTVLHLKSHILLSDIIRWARECRLPYLNPLQFFNPNMKFSGTDLLTFGNFKQVPSSLQIRIDSARLSNFLQLTPYPEFDLKNQVTRLVMDLNLPDSFIAITVKLISTLDLLFPKPLDGEPLTTIPNFEALGVVSVITTLKLLFRLDDVTEFVIAHLQQELHKNFIGKNKPSKPKGLWHSLQFSEEMFLFQNWFQSACDAVVRLNSQRFPNAEDIVRGMHLKKDAVFLAKHHANDLVNKKGSIRRMDLTEERLIDQLQKSISSMLLDEENSDEQTNDGEDDGSGDEDHEGKNIRDPNWNTPASSFMALAAMTGKMQQLNAVGEAEWRASIGASKDLNPLVQFPRFFDKSLEIFTNPKFHQDLIGDDSLLMKLNLPIYNIDKDACPTCNWKGINSDLTSKIRNNKKTLEALFNHQKFYSSIVKRDTEKERQRKGSQSRDHKQEVKDFVFIHSKTVGILVELCARILEQNPKSLLVDIHKFENNLFIKTMRDESFNLDLLAS